MSYWDNPYRLPGFSREPVPWQDPMFTAPTPPMQVPIREGESYGAALLRGMFQKIAGPPAAPGAGIMDRVSAASRAILGGLGGGFGSVPGAVPRGALAAGGGSRMMSGPTRGQATMRINQMSLNNEIKHKAAEWGVPEELLRKQVEVDLQGIPPRQMSSSGKMSPVPGMSEEASLNHYLRMIKKGEKGRPWYMRGGAETEKRIPDPALRDRYHAGLSTTSSETPVAQNTMYTNRGHNQMMAGMPVHTGMRPEGMSARFTDIYNTGAMPKGPKHSAFRGTFGRYSNIVPMDDIVDIVNDFQNMNALGHTGPGGVGPWKGTPTVGQYNFARQIGVQAAQKLNQNSSLPWSVDMAQAAAWTGIKATNQGKAAADMAYDIANGLDQYLTQSVWETVPGKTTGSRVLNRPFAEKLEYHNEVMRNVLLDGEGRDVIDLALGLITKPSRAGAGAFKGGVNPASMGGFATSQVAGGFGQLDDASRALAETSALTHALLLRQDATAFMSPFYRTSIPVKQQNFLSMDIGRALTAEETARLTTAIKAEFGTDKLVPVAHHDGAWFSNFVGHDNLPNKLWRDRMVKVLEREIGDDGKIYFGTADGFYKTNNWSKKGGNRGQVYRRALAGKPPHLQRRAEDILARLGPRLGRIEDDFNARGWDFNANTRLWEDFGGRGLTGHNLAAIEAPAPFPRLIDPREASLMGGFNPVQTRGLME